MPTTRTREQNEREFPSQYEGRRGQAKRLEKLGIVRPNGWRKDAPLGRLAKGRARDESVVSYVARLGRGDELDRKKAAKLATKNGTLTRALSGLLSTLKRYFGKAGS